MERVGMLRRRKGTAHTTMTRAVREIMSPSIEDIATGYTRLLDHVFQGDAIALDALGSILTYGPAPNASLAAACYRVASKSYDGALCNWAACLMEGAGVPQDVPRGLRLLRRAARAGELAALNYLGFCYLSGEGVKKDPSRGFRLSLKAAEAGLAAAQYDVAVCLANGVGTEKDSRAAERWLRLAAKGQDADAMALQARRRATARKKAER
jgi:TPR repeat protein